MKTDEEKMAELVRMAMKIDVNSNYPVTCSDTFYCPNISLANQITEESKKTMSKLKKEFKNLISNEA